MIIMKKNVIARRPIGPTWQSSQDLEIAFGLPRSLRSLAMTVFLQTDPLRAYPTPAPPNAWKSASPEARPGETLNYLKT